MLTMSSVVGKFIRWTMSFRAWAWWKAARVQGFCFSKTGMTMINSCCVYYQPEFVLINLWKEHRIVLLLAQFGLSDVWLVAQVCRWHWLIVCLSTFPFVVCLQFCLRPSVVHPPACLSVSCLRACFSLLVCVCGVLVCLPASLCVCIRLVYHSNYIITVAVLVCSLVCF